MSLDGRVAIVTGAAGGAGRAVVAALAGEGVRLGLVGSRVERLEALAGELGLAPDAWIAGGADLRDAAAARSVVEAVVDRFGRLDIVVHLVGGWTGGTAVTETPDEPYASMLDQHLWTTLNVVRAAVPPMTAAGWGRIVAVSSPVAADPPARQAAYAVGKAAEEAVLATLAREVAGSGVTVNVLRVRAIDATGARDREPSPKNASSTTPEEIAAAILYLCSERAGVVNGARIPLTGAGGG
jgi:NAD(P)-dependent dehydrogenase (short-subunit alcohol dehydrogenase family)